MKSLRTAMLVSRPLLCLAACASHDASSQSDEDAVHGMVQSGKTL